MRTHEWARVTALGASLLVFATCSSSSAAQQARKPLPSDVIATVGDTKITLEQIDERALQQPAGSFGSLKLAQAIYEARRAVAEEMVADLLLKQEAKRRGVEQAALVQQEITSKVTAPTDADVSAWYQANPQRVQGAPLDQVRAPIRALLTQQRTQAAEEAFTGTLKEKTPVSVLIDPPRQAVRAGDSPSKGPASAPVELIEFADFECPYCLAAAPTVKRVLETYGDRIRFVYRNYPLQNHPNARPAAEAAQCANEQGRFWVYHDRLFDNPGKLSDADLKKTAADLGLDGAQFNKCLDEHKYMSTVEADMRAGNEAGVSGTPAFFINGRLLSGSQPFDAFKRVIEEELAAKKR